MNFTLPDKSASVQLTGPDELKLNNNKPVPKPGPYQILGRVEAVGLCFSDLKLLKQFSAHARKSSILKGIDQNVLDEIPSYVPDETPTVPGHEAVVRIWAKGQKVENIELGQRFLVQTDYRWLPTENSNGSFGYNFEGGLQEYVIMDTRVITSPEGESMLIPADENLSASAVALVEPWACVEDSYAVKERASIKENGQMLVVCDQAIDTAIFTAFLARFGQPGHITWVGKGQLPENLDIENIDIEKLSSLSDAGFDDVVYFGHNPEILERIVPKVGPQGLLNIVLCGGKLGRKVTLNVGRTHYGGIRITGTTGSDPADGMQAIPPSGEIRPNDKINVIGAGGPMGVMHVVRNICQGVEAVSVYAGDISDERLADLRELAEPLAKNNGVKFITYNAKQGCTEKFNYTALMAPIPALVDKAISDSDKKAVINIFAGIPATVQAELDMDEYIAKSLYFIGTSGSVLEDMKLVLNKVESGKLDTNLSVAAVTGLDGAVAGIRAVENHEIAGKIIVYPSCKGLGLTRLEQIKDKMPEVYAELNNGLWTLEAEKKLLEVCNGKWS